MYLKCTLKDQCSNVLWKITYKTTLTRQYLTLFCFGFLVLKSNASFTLMHEFQFQNGLLACHSHLQFFSLSYNTVAVPLSHS